MRLYFRNRSKKSSKGFTLVELMIALGLSSIVMGAGFAMFISANRVYQASNMSGITQQGARAALDIMANEIKMAGLGCLNPAAISTIPTALEQEQQMAFNMYTTNATDTSDILQIRANLGGMTLVNEEANSTNLDCSSGGGMSVHPSIGHDLLKEGMNVEILSLDRDLIAKGVLGPLPACTMNGTVRTCKVCGTFTMENASLSSIPTGSVVVQKPLYITYMLNAGRLLRCARSDWTADKHGCDESFLNNPPTPADSNTSYYLADNIVDLQFSYLIKGQSEFLPSQATPLALTLDNRNLINAVKIELLVKSDKKHPMYNTPNCGGGTIQRVYYIGDRQIDVGFDGCKYSYVQMSTIVRIPNMITAGGNG